MFAERIVIQAYTEIIAWLGRDDPTTRRIFEEIPAEEEEHADDMPTLLRGVQMTISPTVGKSLAVTGQEHAQFQALAVSRSARKFSRPRRA